MNHLPENELLSAYLDGELTAEEQARVEQWLAGSPAARQLLEEMRALSATLQSLPAAKIEESLSQRVLRAAERRMLTEPAPLEPSAPEPSAPQPASLSIGRRLLQPRLWLWPAAALAVGLALWIGGPETGPNQASRQLARAPEAAKAPAMPAEEPTIQAAPAGESQPAEAVIAFPKKGSAENGRSGIVGTPVERALKYQDQVLKDSSVPPPVVTKPATPPVELYKQDRDTVEKKLALEEAKKAEAVRGAAPAAKAAPASAAPEPAPAPRPSYAGKLPRKARPGGMPGLGEGGGRTEAGPGEPAAAPEAASRFQVANKAKAAAREGSLEELPLVVVRLGLTPQAADQQALRQILAKERLDRQAGELAAPRAQAEPRPEVAEEAATLIRRQIEGRRAMKEQATSGSKPGQRSEDAEQQEVERVELVTTPEQLQTILQELRARPDQFVSISDDLAQLGRTVQGARKSADDKRSYYGVAQGQQAELNTPGVPMPQLPANQQFGYNQDPQVRMRSQVQIQNAPGDVAVQEAADSLRAKVTHYRVRFELHVAPTAAVAADAALQPAKPAEAPPAASRSEAIPAAAPPASAPQPR
jgi:anti-sigma factor RsiW